MDFREVREIPDAELPIELARRVANLDDVRRDPERHRRDIGAQNAAEYERWLEERIRRLRTEISRRR